MQRHQDLEYSTDFTSGTGAKDFNVEDTTSIWGSAEAHHVVLCRYTPSQGAKIQGDVAALSGHGFYRRHGTSAAQTLNQDKASSKASYRLKQGFSWTGYIRSGPDLVR